MGAYFLKKQARSPILEGFGRNIYALLSFSGQQYKQKYPYAGQLGVALEDGSFYIFGVVETRLEDGTCTEVSLKQQFPNETTSEENKKFGKIVDVLYKLGRGMDYMSFAF